MRPNGLHVALKLVLALWLLGLVLCRSLHDGTSSTDYSLIPPSTNTTVGWPKLAVYDDPWTQQNVALVYAHQLRDGVGAQTMRILEIYAVATSLGIGYVHRPISCVGHVDGHVHYRDSNCSALKEADRRLVEKLRRLIMLQSTVTEEKARTWDQKYVPKLGWNTLTGLATAALQSKRPLLITTEFATSILHYYPDMYLSVPAFQPNEPSARMICQRPEPDAPAVFGRPWLLHALRVAVHFRRGDIAENKRWADRMLPPSYYINVVKKVMEVLDSVGCLFTVEVYSETPRTAEGKAELQMLKDQVPGTVMLISEDLAWSWQMMATADILVMSNSAFSLSAGLMNPNAFSIFFPNAKPNQFRIQMRHWVMPLDRNGTLSHAALDELKRRLSAGTGTSAVAAAADEGVTANVKLRSLLPDPS